MFDSFKNDDEELCTYALESSLADVQDRVEVTHNALPNYCTRTPNSNINTPPNTNTPGRHDGRALLHR
jgi:hypothetical protein